MFRPVNLQCKIRMGINLQRQQGYFDMYLVGKKKISNKVRRI